MRRRQRLVAAAVACAALAAPAAGAGAIRTSVVIFAIADGSQGGGVVGCSGGEALGTGYGTFAGPADLVYLNSLYIAPDEPDALNVYADNLPGGSIEVQALAQMVCDSQAGPSDYRKRQTGLKDVPDASEAEDTAACHGNESVVGGAVYNQGGYSDESYLSSSGPIDLGDKDKLPDDGWHGAVHNDFDGTGDSLQMRVHAFCDTKHNNVEYRSKTTKVNDGALNGAIVACGGARKLIGGGVISHSRYEHALFVSDTLRDQGNWESRVANRSTADGEQRKITTTAICLG